MKSILTKGGMVTLGGREFPVAAPTVTDLARIRAHMRRLAQPQCMSPLLAVNAVADQLLPGVLSESLRLAVQQGAGGGATPTAELIEEQFESLEGVRFQFWYLAHKANAALTLAEVEPLITDDNRFDVADALIAALKPAEDADAPKVSAAGAN